MARRHVHEEHENHERWLVSYADFITLLFAFFVVMYATAQRNPEKEKQFEESIKKYLYQMAAMGGGGEDGGGEGSDLIANPIQLSIKKKGPAEVQDYIARKIKPSDLVEGIYHDSIGVRIRLVSSTLFHTGSAKLNDQSYDDLKSIADIIRHTDGKIIVEGHTDDKPIKSREFPSNWELSSARATRLVRYLIEWQGIDPKNLVAVSYADQKPLVPNTNEKNRAKNRRIEIFITSKD